MSNRSSSILSESAVSAQSLMTARQAEPGNAGTEFGKSFRRKGAVTPVLVKAQAFPCLIIRLVISPSEYGKLPWCRRRRRRLSSTEAVPHPSMRCGNKETCRMASLIINRFQSVENRPTPPHSVSTCLLPGVMPRAAHAVMYVLTLARYSSFCACVSLATNSACICARRDANSRSRLHTVVAVMFRPAATAPTDCFPPSASALLSRITKSAPNCR